MSTSTAQLGHRKSQPPAMFLPFSQNHQWRPKTILLKTTTLHYQLYNRKGGHWPPFNMLPGIKQLLFQHRLKPSFIIIVTQQVLQRAILFGIICFSIGHIQ